MQAATTSEESQLSNKVSNGFRGAEDCTNDRTFSIFIFGFGDRAHVPGSKCRLADFPMDQKFQDYGILTPYVRRDDLP